MVEARQWLVSRGSYSDYRAMCVCPTEADAQAVADKYNVGRNYDEAGIEEILVCGADVERMSVLNLNAEIGDQGQDLGDEMYRRWTEEEVKSEWPFDPSTTTTDVSWRWIRAPMYGGRGGRLEVWGTDHERVRKVFSERRAWLMVDDAARANKEMMSNGH